MLCACHKSSSTMPVIQDVKKVYSTFISMLIFFPVHEIVLSEKKVQLYLELFYMVMS